MHIRMEPFFLRTNKTGALDKEIFGMMKPLPNKNFNFLSIPYVLPDEYVRIN